MPPETISLAWVEAGPADERAPEAMVLTLVALGALELEQVVAASRFMALFLLVTGGASQFFDSASLIPSYHA